MPNKNRLHFKVIAIAGTFDRLHKGHHYFIRQAFKFGERVIIGLTSDEFAKQKLETRNSKLEINYKLPITNFQTRKKELEEFLSKEGLMERAEIVMIDDVYGPAIRRAGRQKSVEIEALAVTADTLTGGQLVNKKRMELDLKPLKLLKVPLILAEDKKRIASTRIRLGEIDRQGKLFISLLTSHLSPINEDLRRELKKPLGKLIRGNPDNLSDATVGLNKTVAVINPAIIITVGDEVTKLCNKVGIAVNLSIFDYKVRREEKYHTLSDLGFKSSFARGTLANGLATVKNPPGHITKELVNAVKVAFMGIITDGNQRIIKVDGEEDLAGVPAILLAPLGSMVIYGQPAFAPIKSGLRRGKPAILNRSGLRRGKPESGVVVVEVTEEIKKILLRLLKL